ncbi:MAG: DUF2807 domain-containing protein [Bacteroidales bacterium]|nr:DUF2807 domain-containing protein [Bacteroidales bacterium]
MKSKAINLVLLLFVVFFFNTRKAISQPGDRCMPVDSFSKLQLYDGIDITLERGDGYYICPGTSDSLENISIVSENGTLKIRKISGNKYKSPPVIKIVFKELTIIDGFSKANISAKNLITGDSIRVTLKSGAVLYASFDVKYLEASLIEGCLFKAEGYANQQNIEVLTKATFSGFGLEGVNGIVKASTAGTAKVNITENLNLTATTGGFINYKGSPALEQKTSLGGKINHEQD